MSAEKVNFLFDIIVTRLQLDNDIIEEPTALLVSLKFNSIPVNITASRINVSDFQAGRRTEFSIDPVALRKNLERAGMPASVLYKGTKLGSAEIILPPSFIDQIGVGMSDLVHADTCHIVRRDEVVGTLDFLCILFIKCEEQSQNLELGPNDKSCGNLGQTIKPADIMFLLSNLMPCPEKSELCLDELEPEEGDERLKLDLSRYSGTKQRVTEPSKETCGIQACCLLKTVTKQYEGLIDSLVEEVNRLPSPMPGNPLKPIWIKRQKLIKHKGMNHTIPVPVGDLEEMGIKPIRFCPVCLTNLSWLPKYANCTKCCAKAVHRNEEILENQLTADQVVREVLTLPTNLTEDFCNDPCDQSKQKQAEDGCRKTCTCKNGIFCLHCRIRNQCSDLLTIAHVDTKSCIKVTPKSNEDFCVIAEPSDVHPNGCRPYLEQVVYELRKLYNKRDKKKTAELKKHCTQSLLRFGNPDDIESELFKSSSPHDLHKAIGGPSMLYRSLVHPKTGHRGCLKRKGNVSRRHGWAWAFSKEARKHGWRPGAICRVAGTVMRYFLQNALEHKPFNICGQIEEAERQKQPPILNVCKKNGNIFITLNAINSPHVDMKPIVIKVVKSNLAVALRQIKKKFKAIGFPKCTCHNTVMMCTCRHPAVKKQLERALEEECHNRRMVNCVDHLVLTDTSDSELEFDFDVSPPSATAKPQLAVKPRIANISTQTAVKDQKVPPMYPKTVGPYWRAFDCAAGDRYRYTAYGNPGENAFEDGVFGHKGGGLHGTASTFRRKIKTSRAGAGGPAVDQKIPGAKKRPGPTPFIPVRMLKRYGEALKRKAQEKEDAIKAEIDKKKKGINPMTYLMKKGAK